MIKTLKARSREVQDTLAVSCNWELLNLTRSLLILQYSRTTRVVLAGILTVLDSFFFLSSVAFSFCFFFILGWWIPNLITGLSGGWCASDESRSTQETVLDRSQPGWRPTGGSSFFLSFSFSGGSWVATLFACFFVCCFVLLNRYWGLESLRSWGHRDTRRDWVRVTSFITSGEPSWPRGRTHFPAGILRVECLLKTYSGYPKDTGVTLFTLATPGNPLCYNTHRSAPPVSALAHSRGPRKGSQSPV